MKPIAITIAVLLLFSSAALAQFEELAGHNLYQTKANWTGPDSLKPYTQTAPEDPAQTLGVRTVWVAQDLDKDGKPEILATDYTMTGRIHVFEYNGTNTLELVWSTPRRPNGGGTGLTPRWVRDGDLDGDGNREIIVPWSLANGADTAIQVFEWTGADNDFGTAPAFELTTSLFTPQMLGKFRMNREIADVGDYDGDGRDELLTCNRDGKVYILGVVGEYPGFASWQIEGGDPGLNPDNKFSKGSWWHSFPADMDGDGTKEIVNHYWNNYGFWSIDPLGPDSYRFPLPRVDSLTNNRAKTDFYHEYTQPNDAVAYMGAVPIDVDGDGKQEIAGVLYGQSYDIGLVSLSRSDTGVYVWRDSSQFGVIGTNLWSVAGKTAGSHWGSAAYDFNGNGRQEYLIGGSGDYNVIALEYTGSGSILDKANYTAQVVFPGDSTFFYYYDVYDSLGTIVRTDRRESPFVAKIYAGVDLDGDGAKELVCGYQSVLDSVFTITYQWDTLAVPQRFVATDTTQVLNTNAVNIKVLEWTGAVFVDQHIRFVTPEDYVLEQNYPNPFNPSTTIRFSLPVAKNISLTVYDMVGREVKRLIGNEEYAAGVHNAEWDGTDNLGKPVASGNYVYTLKFGNFTKSAKMSLLK